MAGLTLYRLRPAPIVRQVPVASADAGAALPSPSAALLFPTAVLL